MNGMGKDSWPSWPPWNSTFKEFYFLAVIIFKESGSIMASLPKLVPLFPVT